MSRNAQTWCNAKGVLKPVTLAMLARKLNRQGTALVDGWAATNPEQVKEWEASGELLAKAQEAQDQSFEVIQKARDQGMTHLSDSEIYEIYGGPTTRL